MCLCTSDSNLFIEKKRRAVLSDNPWPQAVRCRYYIVFDTVPALTDLKAKCLVYNVEGEGLEGVQEKQIC